MFRQSSSRTQKSKGVKVKRVLQICLLLAFFFWLIYQVKHSHDKREEIDEKALEKPAEDRLKLGRKDLLPRDDDEEEEKVVSGGERHDEEVEEEDKHEIEEEEEKKHDIVEEEQEEENMNEVKNDAERGDGDDEFDELGQVKTEGLVDHEEDLLEEEREGEEKVDQTENETLLEEDQGEPDDVTNRNTHEAREEHYKADDASSEVTHDANSNKDYPDSAVYLQSHKSNSTHEINSHNNSDPSLTINQTAANITSLNITAGEEQANSTVLFQSRNLSPNLTEMVMEKPGAPMQNQNSSETVQKSIQAQNVKIEEMINKQRVFIEELVAANQTSKASDSSGSDGTIQNNSSDSSEETPRTDEEENALYSDTASETVDDNSVQHEQIDSSDSDLQEEHANRIDLDTLPDIKTEGLDNEDAVAAE